MTKSRTKDLPLLPLRDVVIFPSVVTPLFVGRDQSIVALQASMASDKQIMLVAQKDSNTENPEQEDLYEVGTISSILQLIKLPDGTVKVLVEGSKRAKIKSVNDYKDYKAVDVTPIKEEEETDEAPTLVANLKKDFQEYVKVTRKTTPEVLHTVNSIDRLGRLTDTLVGHLSINLDQKQELLETKSLIERSKKILSHLDEQLDLTKVEKRVRGRVKKQMEKARKNIISTSR